MSCIYLLYIVVLSAHVQRAIRTSCRIDQSFYAIWRAGGNKKRGTENSQIDAPIERGKDGTFENTTHRSRCFSVYNRSKSEAERR